jgi:predicted nuclease of predicted toxin-antitoxin system
LRFLVDANLSPRVAASLRSAGHAATHVSDDGLLTTDDQTILDQASGAGRTIVSADADFATLLAVGGRSEPSLILLRSADRLTPDQQANVILANLGTLAADLESGAVVTIGRGPPARAHPAHATRRLIAPCAVPTACRVVLPLTGF